MPISLLIAASLFAADPASRPPAPPQPQQAEQRQSDPLIHIESGDAAMTAAIREARASLPDFWSHVAAAAPGEEGFSLKFDLAGSGEFIWAGDLRRENGRITGVLGNRPAHPDFEFGQRVAIDEASIIDWAYYRGGTAIGHRTTRVLLDHMPAEQAAQIRRALGW